jgi:Phytanoyl-CoA dioxygenase (PhyH)
MIDIVEDEFMLRPLMDSFESHGFLHFKGVYTDQQVKSFQELYSRVVADWRYVNGTDVVPDAVGGLLERFPRHVLPAVAHPLLLGFAEAVKGPFVQLDSVVLNSDPAVDADKCLRPVMWHRDRFGSVPPDIYIRPASVVFLSYLQTMTDDVGPLRVVPRSHRQSRLIDDDARGTSCSDEVLVHTSPGDVVAIHHNLLHSGTHNTSTGDRQFFGFIYNLSALRQEDNFAGPNCLALLASAEKTCDRRLARLLGNDALIFPRQNSGFTRPYAKQWERWKNEDRVYAAAASEESETAQRVRHLLAL